MNMVWNNAAWNGLLFDRAWIFAGAGAAAAAVIVAVMALVVGRAARSRPAPGPYREPIARGIEFLVEFVGKDGSAVKDGETMYSQGLAALTLAEPLDRMMLRAK